MVLPDQIGEFGRRVKCSKCNNVWHQKLDVSITFEPISMTPIMHNMQMGRGVNLPALLPIKIPQYLYFLPILLISLILFLSVILFQDTFGIPSILTIGQPSITDVHINNNKDDAKIILSYKVINFSDNEVKMPLVRIRLFDKKHNMLKSHIVDQTQILLAPKQYLNIKTEFPSAPKSAQQVEITLGNKLDFILR
jgi:hypothetical protein